MAREKILIVDDDPRNVEFLRDSLLLPNGYAVEAALDGAQAVQLALSYKPDLILLDLQMPKMDGFEVLEALRKGGHETPTILITAHGSESVAVHAFRLGVRDYFIKPFKVREIMAAIERALAEARLRSEKAELAKSIESINRQLEHRLRQLKVLHSVSKSMTSLLDPDQVSVRVVEAAAYVTGAGETSLYLYDEATHQLELRVLRGAANRRGEAPLETRDDTVVRQVLSTGQMAMIQSPRSLKAQPLHATLAVPLKVRHRSIGVLQAFSEEALEPFTESDRYVLSALADYAAIAIENARLYQAAQSELEERKRAEETVRQLAYHDALTGLPNRTLFNDRLGVALAHARRNRERVAVILLDLDHFKDINDNLGHSMGDKLLQAVGERLTMLLRESDTVCRMGGDEFLLLLPEMAMVEHAATAAERILKAIRNPFALGRHKLHVTASLGIAVYPDDAEDGETLVKNADAAMYRAKESGRDNYQLHAAEELQRAAK